MPHEVVKFEHDPRSRSFGDEAVRALTTVSDDAAEQIYKTLIIAVPEGLAVAVLPASSKLSLKPTAGALGVAKAGMAEPAATQRVTGYVVTAVSSFGQRAALPNIVDSGAVGWERVYVSAGRRGRDVAVAPADLVDRRGDRGGSGRDPRRLTSLFSRAGWALPGDVAAALTLGATTISD